MKIFGQYIKHLHKHDFIHNKIAKFLSQNSHFKKYFIYLFLERGREGERGEKHQCVVASHMPPTGDLAPNPGVCPRMGMNEWPFVSQVGAQSFEPHQVRKNSHFYIYFFSYFINIGI